MSAAGWSRCPRGAAPTVVQKLAPRLWELARVEGDMQLPNPTQVRAKDALVLVRKSADDATKAQIDGYLVDWYCVGSYEGRATTRCGPGRERDPPARRAGRQEAAPRRRGHPRDERRRRREEESNRRRAVARARGLRRPRHREVSARARGAPGGEGQGRQSDAARARDVGALQGVRRSGRAVRSRAVDRARPERRCARLDREERRRAGAMPPTMPSACCA